jgi:hypothetical protein
MVGLAMSVHRVRTELATAQPDFRVLPNADIRPAMRRLPPPTTGVAQSMTVFVLPQTARYYQRLFAAT